MKLSTSSSSSYLLSQLSLFFVSPFPAYSYPSLSYVSNSSFFPFFTFLSSRFYQYTFSAWPRFSFFFLSLLSVLLPLSLILLPCPSLPQHPLNILLTILFSPLSSSSLHGPSSRFVFPSSFSVQPNAFLKVVEVLERCSTFHLKILFPLFPFLAPQTPIHLINLSTPSYLFYFPFQ